jgi:murein DD-endopeptidase MepM/ murein hydrolase activator NlpD
LPEDGLAKVIRHGHAVSPSVQQQENAMTSQRKQLSRRFSLLLIFGMLFSGVGLSQTAAAQPQKSNFPSASTIPTTKKQETGEWVSYYDQQFGFSFDYPADWVLDPGHFIDGNNQTWQVRVVRPLDGYTAIYVTVQSNPNNLDILEFSLTDGKGWANCSYCPRAQQVENRAIDTHLGRAIKVIGHPLENSVSLNFALKGGVMRVETIAGYEGQALFALDSLEQQELELKLKALLETLSLPVAEKLIFSPIPKLELLAVAEAADSFIEPMSGIDASRYNWQNPKLDFGYGDWSNCYQTQATILYHAGADGFGTTTTVAKAVANGIVLDKGTWTPGIAVVIEHTIAYSGEKVYSMYAHLDSTTLAVGSAVRKGDIIGPLLFQPQNTHLHWEMRTWGINPPYFCKNAQGGNVIPHRFGAGYTYPQRPGEFGYVNPVKYVKDHLVITQPTPPPPPPPTKLQGERTFSLAIPWYYLISTGDDRVIDVYLDGTLLFGRPGCAKALWISRGNHTVSFNYDNSAAGMPEVGAQFWPFVSPSCAAAPANPPPAETTPPPSTPVPPSDSTSFLFDLSLPDSTTVSSSQALVKTWRLKNTGTSTWGAGYQLAFVSGEQMGAPNAVNVPTTARNATVDVSINLTAPTASGDHTGYWQMRNSQGTYFGPQIWVKVKTVAASGGGGSSHITSFDVSPASPSAATAVHLVARINAFPEFRAMRFVAGNNTFEMTNFRQVGSQYEISTDWNTASLARGDYALTLEVATQGDTSWANPERQIRTYTLNGTPASTNRAPDRPVLLSPYNWYLKDAAGASTQVQLCVSTVNDPDGDAVEYYFEWSGANPGNSGWVSSTCVAPTLSPNGYVWHAKARDSQGAESGWSVDTWNFNVAFGNVSIGTPTFYQVSDPDNTHICVLVTYGGIIAPEVKAWINLANDGTENGEWRQLDHYGPSTTPDCTASNVHGFWIRSANYTTGNHVIRISAEKNDSGASANKTLIHNIPYMRPPAPHALAPSSYENNGTWWNTRTITFQWTVPLRTESQTLRVSTSSNVWGDPGPLLEVPLSNTASQYTYTFNQDYGQLYWSVRATNSSGSADFGALWFGVDLVAPTCAVSSPSLAYDNNFQVNWSGADNAAGVRSYQIWASDLEGATGDFWRTALAAQTYDLFNGRPGHHYNFYCRVTDNAGNLSDWQSYAATQVDPNARPPAPWWNAAYAYKRTVTVLNNMPGVTLSNGYPVKLRFDGTTTPSAAEIYNASWSSPKCNDLRIVYNDATELNRTVTKCSASEIELWFRTQADVAGGTNNAAYQMYYSNASSGTPPNSRNQVFYPVTDASYLRVFDMREGNGQTVYDAVSNVNATLGSELTWVNGKFGPAVRIPGDQTPEPRPAVYADYGNQPTCAFTVELWLKRLSGHNYGGVLAEQEIGGPNPWRWIFMIQDSKLRLNVEGRGDAMGSASLSDATFFDNWHHLAVTYACNGETRFYIDGQLDAVRQIGGGGLNPTTAPLRIGNNAYSSQRLAGDIQGFALSNIAQTAFPYAVFSAITNEPTVGAGAPQTPPTTGTRTLDVLGVNTYPNPGGGLLVEAIVRNSGTLPTGNGFSTDIYLNHIPTGQGDRTGSVSFWVNDPIGAGATVTLTTVITDAMQLGALRLASPPTLAPADVALSIHTPIAPLAINTDGEITGTLYAQADSTGAVMNGATGTSIYATGTSICVASPDVYELGSDSQVEGATVLALNTTQRHNFHQQSDSDWVAFTAEEGKTYWITTGNLGAAADTYLYLYDNDTVTLLASNDDYANSLASRIEWTAPASALYYARVIGWNPNVQGCGTGYDLSLSYALKNKVYLPLIRR